MTAPISGGAVRRFVFAGQRVLFTEDVVFRVPTDHAGFWSRSRRFARVAIVGAATGSAVIGLAAVAAAPPATAAPTAAAARKTSVALCNDPSSPDMARCYALRLQVQGATPFTTAPQGYGPADIQAAYKLPANGGAGVTIAIVDAHDNPNAASDLATYRSTYGLPALKPGQFRKVSQRGTTDDLPSPDAGWAGEIILDLDAVTSVAPNANILLVEGDTAGFNDLGIAVNQAVAMGAKYVSNSYGSNYSAGSGEDPSQLQGEAAYYDHPGVAIVASTGDYGYGVSYPASSPHVTAVGGTSLTKDTSARGWSESAWDGAGSGCSAVQPKPAFQTDAGCSMRAVADVSAVADPATGLAVYNTYQANGWAVYGGTSLSAPLITATYALAGTPAAGSYPNSYPYAANASLNDVTSGANGSCDAAAAYLCQATTGYDGPTGLGTPNGVTAFAVPIRGTITGTVLDRATGQPVVGAEVTAGSGNKSVSTTTGADGSYVVSIAPGTYTPTVAKFGYTTPKATTVTVTKNHTVTADVSLVPLPTRVVSGTVTAGSGHHWPLYSQISLSNVPGGTVYTDPYTGRYSISLPTGVKTTMTVSPVATGYTTRTASITVGSDAITKNFTVPVDTTAQTAEGYKFTHRGLSQTFDGSTIPAGWTTDNPSGGADWTFTDPQGHGNQTGGTGGYAVVDSDAAGFDASQDTSLVTPVMDMSTTKDPRLDFDSHLLSYGFGTATAELSTDGGATWTSLQQLVGYISHYSIDLPTAAGKRQVQVRFHYVANGDGFWELDDVQVGDTVASPVAGGLVAGQVLDATTNTGVDAATVTSGTIIRTSTATGDPAHPHGYYEFFSPTPGSRLQVKAIHAGYTPAAGAVTVTNDALARRDLTLKSGRLGVSAAGITATANWKQQTTQTVTLSNTGTAPVTAQVTEGPGTFTLQGQAAQTATPTVTRVSTPIVAGSLVRSHGSGTTDSATSTTATATPHDGGWQPVPDLPVGPIGNSSVNYNGVLYSFGGFYDNADHSDLFAYNTSKAAGWTTLTSAVTPRESAAMVVFNGKLIVVGGLTGGGAPATQVETYDIATDTWSTGATDPAPLGGAGYALVGTKLYMVGGCATAANCATTKVEVYDVAAGTFATAANYPEPVAFSSCGEISGKLYCAGGSHYNGSAYIETAHTYVLNPATSAWSKLSDMPVGEWGAITTAANGQLLLGGGVIDSSTGIWNAAFGYNPASDTWTKLPNMISGPVFRGGGAVGWYQVGGGGGNHVLTSVSVLPQFNQSEASQVSWMTETPTRVTLQPGATTTVTVTLNANDATITQPGTLNGSLGFITDGPFPVANIPVAFTVKPPSTWGEITGVVSGTTRGVTAPVAGATVRLNTWAGNYTLITDGSGTYALYLDVRSNPLQVLVAKDGFVPVVDTVTIKKGAITTHDVTLASS